MSPRSVEVIVRAARDEPVRLRAVGSVGDRIEVCGSVPELSIRYPDTWVYEFSVDEFAALRKAYEAGNAETLVALWSKQKRFDGRNRLCATAT